MRVACCEDKKSRHRSTWVMAHMTTPPHNLPTDAIALCVLLLAEREVARLRQIIREPRRHRFGRPSERPAAD